MAEAEDFRSRRMGALVTHDGADELESVRSAVVLFDKTFRTFRTYGRTNHLSQRFLRELQAQLLEFFLRNGKLALLVQRFSLVYGGEVVYERPGRSENLAFKLYADGIRELALGPNLGDTELETLLAVLAGEYDEGTADEDIVTRLWEENLSGVLLVTAEEIISSGGSEDVFLPAATLHAATLTVGGITGGGGGGESAGLGGIGGEARPLGEILAAEQAGQGPVADGSGAVPGRPHPGERGVISAAAYAVAPHERDALLRDMAAEGNAPPGVYVVEALISSLAGEEGPPLASIADLVPEMVDVLVSEGSFVRARALWMRLAGTEGDADEDELRVVAIRTLGEGRWLASLVGALNRAVPPPTVGLRELCSLLRTPGVEPLCRALSELVREAHRGLVSDILAALAREDPAPVLQRIHDERPAVCRAMLGVMERIGDGRYAESLAPALGHSEAAVRVEAMRCFRMLRPRGSGTLLVRLAQDEEDGVRHEALRALGAGTYTAPLSSWEELIAQSVFLQRARPEKRAVFQAVLRTTAPAEAVTLLTMLVTRPMWLTQTGKIELGVLAASALGDLGSPAAKQALQAGQRRFIPALRKACADALAKTPGTSGPGSPGSGSPGSGSPGSGSSGPGAPGSGASGPGASGGGR